MRQLLKRVILCLFLITCVFDFVLPGSNSVFADDSKKKQKLREELLKLKKKKAEIEQKTKEKIKETKEGQEQQSLEEIIARYESLYEKCKDQKSYRCADVLYTLAKLYNDKAADDYRKARDEYNLRMDEWEKKRVGPEPQNPVPDYSKPHSFYKKAVQEYPDFRDVGEAYYQIGNINRLMGNTDLAVEAFENVIEKEPNSIRASAAHFRLSDFCFMDRDFTCALKHIENIDYNQVPVNIQEMSHYRKAEIYYNRADFDKAAQLFYEYIDQCDAGIYKKKDLREEALEYLSVTFSDMPDGGERAVDFFKKIGDRSYKDTVLYTVGMKNFDHGQYDAAIKALETAREEYPYYYRAPEAQQMIVASHVIKKKYDVANSEREKLVDAYSEGSAWASRNSRNKVALAKAKKEIRKALAQIPVHYHAAAQKQKKLELYQKALKRYLEYFDKFPEDKWKIYEFKYNVAELYNTLKMYRKAAEAYNYVASQELSTYPEYKLDVDTSMLADEEKEKMLSKGGKKELSISQEDAGYNAVVALDNLRKKKKAQEGLDDKALYSMPVTNELLENIRGFYRRFPTSEMTPELIYLGANIHYTAEKYDRAISEFQVITKNYSNSEYYKKSLRMLGNSYVKSEEFKMALATYNKMLINEKPGTEGYKEIIDLAGATLYKQAERLQKAGDYIKAAQAYKSIQSKFPKSKAAGRGWFEAGVAYEQNENYELAAENYLSLEEKFPDSDLRKKAFVRSAENFKKIDKYERAAEVYVKAAKSIKEKEYAIPSLSFAYEAYKKIGEYKKAGKISETISQAYPADKRSVVALYNAGLVYEKGDHYNEAIRVYRLLSEKYPQSEYSAEGFYSIGFCYEKAGDSLKMAQAFVDYAEKYVENKARQVEAFVKAAQVYFGKSKITEAEKYSNIATKIYEKFKRKAPIDVGRVSNAYFILGQVAHAKFSSIKLTGKYEKTVQDKIEEKTKGLEPVLKYYTEAIKFGVEKWTIRSTYMIAETFIDMAESIRNQKLFGTKEQQVASKIRIISDLEKYYTKAMEQYGWVINKAYEQNLTDNEYLPKAKERFAEYAYRKGKLFEEIGEMFKNAPIPNGLDEEERLAYRDILDERYLKALDAALPKYEGGIEAIAHYNIAGSRWVDSIKSRIEYINPSSKALAKTIKPHQWKAKVVAGGDKKQVSSAYDDEYRRAMERIRQVVEMRISVEDKISQLKRIELSADRKIKSLEAQISRLKEEK